MNLKNVFTKNEWLIFGIIVFIGISLRWYGLDIRPLHHDESLNAIYGRYFYENATTGYYKYNPMLHGPFLYHVLPYIYQLFGISKFAIRFLPCLLGSLFIFMPLIFNRFFKAKTIILQSFLIALSPGLIYWSRFLRHDYIVISSFLIILAGLCFTKKYKSFFFTIGLAIHFVAKENIFITFALLLGFIIYEAIISNFSKDSLIKISFHYCIKYKIQTIIGFLLSIFIFCYFYSAGFIYNEGILDGLYRKSIVYWLNEHNVSRISGPFIYQFLTLSWYDHFFIILFFTQIIHFYKQANFTYRISFLISIIFSLISYFTFERFNISVFKLIFPVDSFLFFPLIAHAVLVTTKHLKENSRLLAFLGYFFFATFFTYSYVGEKVPWLSLYILFTGIPYLALYMQHHGLLNKWHKLKIINISVSPIIYGLIFLFTLRMGIITNFTNAGKANEFISQVHTTAHYENIIYKIKDQILNPYKSKAPLILDYAENTWPLTWYFLNLPEFRFSKAKKEVKKYNYIFAGQINSNLDFELLETHSKVLIPMRHWWWPDYSKMTLWNFLNYSLHHNPWNPPGEKFISLYTKYPNDK